MDRLANLCYGVIYGQAIGDALGLGTEFLSKSQVEKTYPYGLRDYQGIIRDQHRRRWAVGDWTDDTDQMLCILNSLIENGAVDLKDIARRIYTWASGGGMGIGRLVRSVVYANNFLSDPHQAAKNAWEASGRHAAPNGGIMRTSILGVWQYQNIEQVKANAENVCRITHYDPRCVGSCVAVCVAISLLLQEVAEPNELINRVIEEISGYDTQVIETIQMAAQSSLEALDLDEGLNPGEPDRAGYTLKALGAGFWALKNAILFEDGLLQVIHEGGDADSNAAVAGALLGARFGMTGIPPEWKDGLYRRRSLDDKIAALLHMMHPNSD